MSPSDPSNYTLDVGRRGYFIFIFITARNLCKPMLLARPTRNSLASWPYKLIPELSAAQLLPCHELWRDNPDVLLLMARQPWRAHAHGTAARHARANGAARPKRFQRTKVEQQPQRRFNKSTNTTSTGVLNEFEAKKWTTCTGFQVGTQDLIRSTRQVAT